MDKYSIIKENNYIRLENLTTNEVYYGQAGIGGVFIDASNINKRTYKFFNIKDWDPEKTIKLEQLVNSLGINYSEEEWLDFYTNNTGVYENTIDTPSEETLKKLVNFAIGEYDEIIIEYVTAGNGIGEIDSVIYKLNSVVVTNLIFMYDTSNRLINCKKI